LSIFCIFSEEAIKRVMAIRTENVKFLSFYQALIGGTDFIKSLAIIGVNTVVFSVCPRQLGGTLERLDFKTFSF
jgi:hypothetical protein